MKPTEQIKTKTVNEHVLGGLWQADAGVKWLVQNGYTVLSVEIGARNPLIWIANCSACQRLDGVMVIRQSGERGIERVMAALVAGCQVQWRVCGH